MKTGLIVAGAAALTLAGAAIAQTGTPPPETMATPGQDQTTDQARTGGQDYGQPESQQRHERKKAHKEKKGTTGSGTATPEPSPSATPTETPTPAPEANPTPDATPTPRA